MKERKNSLVPLKFIRIAKDMKSKEMAEAFGVTTAYISAIETTSRNIRKQTLIYGLQKLNINYADYLELEALSYELSLREDIDDLKKYRIMLIKAIGVINPTLKQNCEELLNTYYIKQEKRKSQTTSVKKKVKIVDGKIIMY